MSKMTGAVVKDSEAVYNARFVARSRMTPLKIIALDYEAATVEYRQTDTYGAETVFSFVIPARTLPATKSHVPAVGDTIRLTIELVEREA